MNIINSYRHTFVAKLEKDKFFGWFISSNIASKFEKGNPKYVAGMSGYELAETIYHEADVSKFVESANEIIARNKKYEI